MYNLKELLKEDYKGNNDKLNMLIEEKRKGKNLKKLNQMITACIWKQDYIMNLILLCDDNKIKI